MEYDPTGSNHYPISYLDEFGRSQTCPYIHYIFNEGIPMIQGCIDPSQGIYGEILHARPATTPGIPGADDNFTSFHPHLTQRLLIDNALAGLEDIGIITEVSCYRAALIEENIQHQNVAHAEGALCHAREKKISCKGYIFCTHVHSCIHHLLLNPSTPPSPDPSSSGITLVASQGPSNDGWGPTT